MYSFNEEQALAILLHNKYKIENALADLNQFEIFNTKWNNTEIKLLKDGLKEYSKHFDKIQIEVRIIIIFV